MHRSTCVGNLRSGRGSLLAYLFPVPDLLRVGARPDAQFSFLTVMIKVRALRLLVRDAERDASMLGEEISASVGEFRQLSNGHGLVVCCHASASYVAPKGARDAGQQDSVAVSHVTIIEHLVDIVQTNMG